MKKYLSSARATFTEGNTYRDGPTFVKRYADLARPTFKTHSREERLPLVELLEKGGEVSKDQQAHRIGGVPV